MESHLFNTVLFYTIIIAVIQGVMIYMAESGTRKSIVHYAVMTIVLLGVMCFNIHNMHIPSQIDIERAIEPVRRQLQDVIEQLEIENPEERSRRRRRSAAEQPATAPKMAEAPAAAEKPGPDAPPSEAEGGPQNQIYARTRARINQLAEQLSEQIDAISRRQEQILDQLAEEKKQKAAAQHAGAAQQSAAKTPPPSDPTPETAKSDGNPTPSADSRDQAPKISFTAPPGGSSGGRGTSHLPDTSIFAADLCMGGPTSVHIRDIQTFVRLKRISHQMGTADFDLTFHANQIRHLWDMEAGASRSFEANRQTYLFELIGIRSNCASIAVNTAVPRQVMPQ